MKVKIHGQRGVLLVEFIVLLIIVSIFATISAPAFCGAIKKSETETTASKIATWLSSLRQRSLNQQEDYKIICASDVLTSQAPSGGRATKREAPKSIHFECSSNQIYFYASGAQTPSTIRVIYRNSSAQKTCAIRLALRGRVLVECT